MATEETVLNLDADKVLINKKPITDYLLKDKQCLDDRYNTKDEIEEKLSTKSNISHDHDDRYYTAVEMEQRLYNKSNINHLHDDRYYTGEEVDNKLKTKVDINHSHNDLYYNKKEVDDKLTDLANLTHDHDDRYYLKDEIDNELNTKANIEHKHDDRYYTKTEVRNELNDKSNVDHNHNEEYYTKIEVNTKLHDKSNTTHLHDERYYTKNEIDDRTANIDHLHDERYYTKDEIDSNTSSINHNHDGRYYTESEIDDKIKLLSTSKANVIHSHDNIYYNKSEIETKLSNKSNINHTHEDLYYTQSDMINLLDAKSNINHSHNDIYYTENEIDDLLINKSGINHSHNDIYYTENEIDNKLANKSDTSHLHDDRYYTENEIDNKLNTKSNTNHNHDSRYYLKLETDNLLDSKSDISHLHDDRYYTEDEIDNKLSNKSDNNHLHDDRYYNKTELDDILANKSNINHNHNDIYYTENELNNLLATKSDNTHLHDGRYYTETEVDTKLATKSDNTHLHDDRYYTETEVDTKVNDINDKLDNTANEIKNIINDNLNNITDAINLKSNIEHNHDGSYLQLSGGTTTGKVIMKSNGLDNLPQVYRVDSDAAYFVGIRFQNSSGYLGSIGITGTANSVAQRLGSDGNLYPILDTSNYNNYVPKKDGTGASGTWNINISGNSTSSNKTIFRGDHVEAASGTTASIPTEGMLESSGMYMTGNYNDTNTPATYGNIINLAGHGSGQLLCEWIGTDVSYSGHLYYRSHRDTSTIGWSAWSKIPFMSDLTWANVLNKPTLYTKSEIDSKLTSKFSDSYNSNTGDICKIDSSGKINCEKLIKVLRAAGNSSDVSKLTSTKVSMQEMFSSWIRISCAQDGTNQNSNNSDQTLARSSYYYDSTNDAIICSRNSDSYSAFISNEKYGTNWTIEYRMDQRYAPGKGGDNDLLQFVIAYMVDSNGNFHTISINRMSGSSEHSYHGFTLAYDLYTAWQNDSLSPSKWIKLGEVTVNAANWNNNYTKVKVVRTATTIQAQTADPNQDSYNANYIINWTLPTTKPDDWSQEAYDNIKYMMSNRCQIGFGTQSNISAFKVDSQTGLFDEITIYDLSSGQKKTYKNGSVISSETVDLSVSPETLIYSVLTEKLFYYKGNGSFIELIPLSRVTKLEQQVLELKNALAELTNKVNSNY